MDPGGRYTFAKLKINYQIILGTIYTPNVNKTAFFDSLNRFLVEFGRTKVLIGGDWTLALDPIIARTGTIDRHSLLDRVHLKDLIQDFGFSDP